MSKKTLAITGPTSGLGLESTLQLANDFDEILLICRNLTKGKNLKEKLLSINPNLSVDLIKCDLSDLQSVNQAGRSIKQHYSTIDCLINNAGMVSISKKESKDGFEIMMATNYIGPFLLTFHLLPLVLKSNQKQIVIVSSGSYKFAPMKAPFFKPKRFNPITGYGRSKLATLYLAQELHEKFYKQDLKVTAVHPGVVSTNIGKNNVSKTVGDWIFKTLDPFFITAREGSDSIVSAVRFPQKYAGFYSHEGEIIAVRKHGSDFKMRREFIDKTFDLLRLDNTEWKTTDNHRTEKM